MMASNDEEGMGMVGDRTLESVLGYYFNEPELRDRVSHRRPARRGRRPADKDQHPGLATLGEAVMGCVVVNHFYAQGLSQAEINEEWHTRVSRDNHARLARTIGLPLLLSGDRKLSRNVHDMDLGECLEEIVGAVYLDDINAGGTGVGACWEVMKRINMI
jgi:hypothetical protein